MYARILGMVMVSTALTTLPARADSLTADQQRAHDIYKELVEIDTTTATGDTRAAAEAMAARLKAAGFGDADAQALSPAPRKGNLVARLRGQESELNPRVLSGIALGFAGVAILIPMSVASIRR